MVHFTNIIALNLNITSVFLLFYHHINMAAVRTSEVEATLAPSSVCADRSSKNIKHLLTILLSMYMVCL